MASLFDLLTKLTLKNDNMIGVLSQGFAEHAALMLQTLERCACNGCKQAATVRHQTLGIHCCDHCAARLITKSRKNAGVDTNVNLNLLRKSVAEEELWIDLPNALGIRRAQDLVTMSSYQNESDVPERGSMEWQ